MEQTARVTMENGTEQLAEYSLEFRFFEVVVLGLKIL